jgi:hypothetical protein
MLKTVLEKNIMMSVFLFNISGVDVTRARPGTRVARFFLVQNTKKGNNMYTK